MRRDAVVKAVERVRPSVVNIHGEKTLAADERHAGAESARRVNGMGTGVIVDERGYILTNFHVVDGVRKIQITLADGRNFVARLVANDTVTDLAVIKINVEEELPVAHIGTSADLMLGEPVVAVGNAYGYENTVTRGIISALHRSVQVTEAQQYSDLIQTDASINPGNSGGPLVNIDGEMIGINVAVRAGALGIGFAIPIDKAMAVASELLCSRRLDRTWHGLAGNPAHSGKANGFLVASVAEESPASKGGLKPGDLVTAVGERPVARALDFERALLGKHSGEKVELTVERDQKPTQLTLVLADLPEPPEVGDDADPTWSTLGLRLEPIPPKEFQQYHSRYRGGLMVRSVRNESPAAKQGIREGDVLVGMHVWETVSLENVSYILNRPDFDSLEPVKFYILRGKETLYGHLSVSMRSKH